MACLSLFTEVVQYCLVNRLSDLELTIDDKVNVVYFRLALFVDDFTALKLHFLHVVIDLCDHIGPQGGKNAVVAQLLHNPLHFSTLLLTNYDAEVVSSQIGKARFH